MNIEEKKFIENHFPVGICTTIGAPGGGGGGGAGGINNCNSGGNGGGAGGAAGAGIITMGAPGGGGAGGTNGKPNIQRQKFTEHGSDYGQTMIMTSIKDEMKMHIEWSKANK